MTGIFFGSTMGTTEAVAADIAKQLGVADADVHNVADTPAGEVQKYDLLVLGSSTWGAGELQDDWYGFLDQQRWQWLMAAHIVGQQRLGLHLHSHLFMLRLALSERDWPEVAGQVLRLLLVPLGNGTGRLPLGNVGRATVSAFEPMPVAGPLRRLITEAREAARAHSSPPQPAN